jgi:hypothetical protein
MENFPFSQIERCPINELPIRFDIGPHKDLKPKLLPILPSAAMLGGLDGAHRVEANGGSLGETRCAPDSPAKEAALWV